jgi:Calcineurin-like phosphoesterase
VSDRVRASVWMRTVLTGAALVACLAAVHCGGGNSATGPTPPTNPPGDPPGPPTTPPPPAPSQIFVGAGDIAMCDALEPARQTSQLLRTIGGTVFTLGDNAYFSGSAREYRDCYDPTWGSERGRTRPVPGNHEYDGASAGIPYFSYFGTQAGPAGLGYYSYDLGAWHIIALNSNLSPTESSPQGVWLRNDLAANRAKCTLAYWHHPLFTSSQNGPQNFTRDFWRQLYAAGADVILGGHDHTYERFGLQDPDGRPDPTRGIREFVVGTGGATLYQFPITAGNSQVRLRAFGLLKLTLDSESYDWQFIQVGGAVGDSGTAQCH